MEARLRMANSLTPRIQALRAQITALLGSQIGTYQFQGGKGQTAQAIAVLPDPHYGMSYPPAGTKVVGTGLEVVLLSPQIAAQPLLNGWANRDDWTIYLRSHKNDSLYDAVIALQEGVKNITQLFTIPASEANNIPQTVRLTVSDYCYIQQS